MNNLLRYSHNIIFTVLTAALVIVLTGYLVNGQAYASQIVKDPTRPLVNFGAKAIGDDTSLQQNKSNTELILQGVLVENGRKVAVINNRLVRIGEQIEGYTVTGIIPYGAQLSLEEETLSLSLVSENIKISK